jgi:hypothetical protein
MEQMNIITLTVEELEKIKRQARSRPVIEWQKKNPEYCRQRNKIYYETMSPEEKQAYLQRRRDAYHRKKLLKKENNS